MRLTLLLVLVLVVPVLAGEGPVSAEAAKERVVAGSWFERHSSAWETVTALYLREKPGTPLSVWIGHGGSTDEAPGEGRILTKCFANLELRPGELLLCRRTHRLVPDPDTGETSPASAVLVTLEKPESTVDVHDLIHGELGPGGFYFERPPVRSRLNLSPHVVEIGTRLELGLLRPGPEFFRGETMRLARVARRLALDSDDPDGPAGHVAVTPILPPTRDELAHILEGKRGEDEFRAFFHDPRCAFANRRVNWMKDLLIIRYRQPTSLQFELNTAPVKRAGRVSSLWKGYGAVAIEAIHRNGFGGSSENLNLPTLIVVPEGTAVRQVSLR